VKSVRHQAKKLKTETQRNRPTSAVDRAPIGQSDTGISARIGASGVVAHDRPATAFSLRESGLGISGIARMRILKNRKVVRIAIR
jgi:hypothetical protein